MSWSNWYSRGPSLKQEPTPEPAPPSFHKPGGKKREKPFTIEVRYLHWSLPKWEQWHTLQRYCTEEARDRALAKFMRVDHRVDHREFRVGSGPESQP